jgi:SAM-dependent methyltransferase
MDDIEAIRRYYAPILPYYDRSLAERGDLPFWASMASRWGSTRILELGCGTGRVTEVLCRHAPVTAIDLLIEMLLPASRKVPVARFIAADLRRFTLGAQVDLIVLADDPMTHLTSMEDRVRVMRLIADHLEPDGRVVLEGLIRQVSSPPIVTQRNALTIEETWTPTADPSVWEACYRYDTVEVHSVMRAWSRADLDQMEESGLEVESVWGDFDESAFSEDSPRIIVVAKGRERV